MLLSGGDGELTDDVEDPFGSAPLDLEQRSRVVAAGSEEICGRIASALRSDE